MATEPTEPTESNLTPKLFFPFTPTPFRGGGREHNFRGGAAGVRAFRGFRGSSRVGWKGRESSLQSLAPKFPEEPKAITAETAEAAEMIGVNDLPEQPLRSVAISMVR